MSEKNEDTKEVLRAGPEAAGALDRITQKVISRKFLAWLVATLLLLVSDNLSGDQWVTITALYIGGQTVIDSVATLRK